MSNKWILAILLVYFLPTIISLLNKKSKTFPIFTLNFLFGWTILMWISMLFESFYDTEKSKDRTGYKLDEVSDVVIEGSTDKKRAIWTVDYVLDIVHWNKFIK